MYFRMEGETERDGQAEGEKDAQRQRQRRQCKTLYFRWTDRTEIQQEWIPELQHGGINTTFYLPVFCVWMWDKHYMLAMQENCLESFEISWGTN